jgi:hypothetical protein
MPQYVPFMEKFTMFKRYDCVSLSVRVYARVCMCVCVLSPISQLLNIHTEHN